MTELTEQEQQRLNTGRLMRAESEILLPYIESRQKIILGQLVTAFKAGQNERLITYAAELSTLHDMRSEIKNKIKQAEDLEQKFFSGNGFGGYGER